MSAAPSCNGCNDVQIEYILPETVSCWAKVTQAGTDNGTMIQFVGEGNCASMGVANPADFCQSDPLLVIPCYENGSGIGNTNTVLVSFPYSSTGTTPTPSSDFTADQLGALWGVAYQRQTQRVFTSSF